MAYKSKKIKPGCKINEQNCKSCPFSDSPDALVLGSQKLAEVQTYLIEGMNHLCHSDRRNMTICKGGHDYVLEMWHRMGRISAPTTQALINAMQSAGVSIQPHILNHKD